MNINEIISRIDELLNKKERVIIAIDGMSHSYKSTFGEYLKKKYDGTLIHMDDFYNPLNDFNDIKDSINGNINYKYLKSNVIDKLNDKYVSFAKFDCKTQSLLKNEVIFLKKLIVIEGTYSLNKCLGKYYDLSIFLYIDKDTQVKRIKNNLGSNAYNFLNKRVKLENNYFNYNLTFENINVTLDTRNISFETFF